ncbi:hypothetical protein [Gracilibacillus phocaeensis]|uniref:hypothetical protein n=1 Tax=Gracilibacillus phocaeensis TaxID=2042304 RepID=UPI0013EF4C02|nr:hypothetical protein [Gracilibacillus phocaeensis]
MKAKVYVVLVIILVLNGLRYLEEYITDTTNWYYGVMLALNLLAICLVVFSRKNQNP